MFSGYLGVSRSQRVPATTSPGRFYAHRRYDSSPDGRYDHFHRSFCASEPDAYRDAATRTESVSHWTASLDGGEEPLRAVHSPSVPHDRPHHRRLVGHQLPGEYFRNRNGTVFTLLDVHDRPVVRLLASSVMS
jgi:hypothetical protein